ncbi:MBL fold metallo-hydrolase [Ammoniphilus sp. CFH 90114]|uniref:MBL fold metallo-hydrolase n=1 Tax=Ammoniphilus sp. CFH 90114 TaxID=2493665 RepID=UPI00100DA386|nr:MBL fold metallo-hydrolase [Ammoniphilus sp. CFH 90114]RXT04557.1 MBL fold metallo-hydrolase [Ammoniphilus sp. CFH 90114]
MLLQKLSWAGVLIQSEDTVILIDPLGRTPEGQEKPLAGRVGEPLEPLLTFDQLPKPTAILISHIHPDHFDPISITQSFGTDLPVLVPIESVEMVKQTGLTNVIGVTVGYTETYNTVTVKAAQSVDGYGTPQVSWIVEGKGGKVIHFSDTLFHGYWWRIAREHGPFEAACLPVNGPVLEVYGLPQQSVLPACMTPEEAVEAAKILGAKRLVPIHFGTFHNPPYYIETPNLIERLERRAAERDVPLTILQAGESVQFS